MNFSAIKTNDIANGPGVRVSLFVSGCDLRCDGCFNASAWDFGAGEPFTVGVLGTILDELGSDRVAGLSVLGGEPLHPMNAQGVRTILRAVRDAYPNKGVWVWTGRTYEDVMASDQADVLDLVDVLVDGPFVSALRDMSLRFRGSSNQRIIDVARSRDENRVVTWSDGLLYDSRGWVGGGAGLSAASSRA